MLEQGLDLMLGRAHVVDLSPAIVVQIAEVHVLVRHPLTHVASQFAYLAAVAQHEVDDVLAIRFQVLHVVDFLQGGGLCGSRSRDALVFVLLLFSSVFLAFSLLLLVAS